ncbi:hypothetical protein BCAR13_110069 [Paraburkholderia caribensis]|uniref:hypothetical protein n=1 Tax=Paraburkholderia caribensis TaxID=75105 RepID=UPI001CAE814B|nr:hypothetical protein [Paraburkholderia caribensis]CAG9193951.1 hypothetical protein BCAR13_110069 [Paraburkholderia caribensis]
MPKARFLSVLVKLDPAQDHDKLTDAMNKSLDWFRLADNYYVAYSTGTLDQWKSRLAPLVKPNGYMFVAPLDMSEHKGYATKAFWDWVKQMPEKHSSK